MEFPFWATGIKQHDLAVFGSAMDENGVSEHGFLVTSSSQDQGQLVDPQLVEEFPDLQTIELAKKFATLKPEELAQLSIDSLVKVMQRRYPGIKGFVR